MNCMSCGTDENLLELRTVYRNVDDETLGEEQGHICESCALTMVRETWGQSGVEVEVETVREDGTVERVGWDGETTYVPVDLPEDASTEQVFQVMADAARQLGFET